MQIELTEEELALLQRALQVAVMNYPDRWWRREISSLSVKITEASAYVARAESERREG